jgi:hypothetical protein
MTATELIKALRQNAADTPLHDRNRALMLEAADKIEHAYLIIEDSSDGRRRHLDELDSQPLIPGVEVKSILPNAESESLT